MKVYRLEGHEYPFEDLTPALVVPIKGYFVSPTVEMAMAWSAHLWNGFGLCKYVLEEWEVNSFIHPTANVQNEWRYLEEYLEFPPDLEHPFQDEFPYIVEKLRGRKNYRMKDAVVLADQITSKRLVAEGFEFNLEICHE